MAMTLLEIVQQTRARLGQPIPSYVVSNPDAGIVQCLGLLNEFLEDLVTRQFWASNTREATFVSVATESQGLLSTLFPFGYEGLLPDTFYNRTTKLPVTGGLTPAEWASRKASGVSGPLPSFRIRGGELLLNPIPAAGQTFAVEYLSNNFIYNAADPGPVYRKYWLKDLDTCILDDALPMSYLKWAWRREKGLDYAEDFRKYETLLASKALRETVKPAISLDGGFPSIGPGMVVSPGSWPL